MRLEQIWRYARGTIYLDASALTYNFEGKPLAYVLGPEGRKGWFQGLVPWDTMADWKHPNSHHSPYGRRVATGPTAQGPQW